MLVVLDDDRVDFLVFVIFRSSCLPRIIDERLDRERYLVVLYLDDFDFYVLADLVARFRILNQRPIHFRDLNPSLKAFLELNEYAELGRAGDYSLDYVAHVIFFDERCALRSAGSFLT